MTENDLTCSTCCFNDQDVESLPCIVCYNLHQGREGPCMSHWKSAKTKSQEVSCDEVQRNYGSLEE